MHLFNDYAEITKFLTSGGKVDIRFKRRYFFFFFFFVYCQVGTAYTERKRTMP